MPGPTKTNCSKKVNYEVLALEFEHWWLKLLDDYFIVSQDRSIPPELLTETGCSTPAEFEESLIKPLISLTPETIQKVMEILTRYHYHHSRKPLTFEVSYTYKRRFEAIFFLLAQVERLQLFPLKEREEIASLFRQPFKQCLWCGQIDFDPNGDPFHGSRRCCHALGCPEIKKKSNPNPTGHAERGCCAGEWKLFGNQIKQKIDRDAADTDEAWQYLKAACETLLTHNQQKLKYSMRHVDSKTGQLVEAYLIDSLLSPAEGEQELVQMIKEGL